jgi:hypothetical protein
MLLREMAILRRPIPDDLREIRLLRHAGETPFVVMAQAGDAVWARANKT